MLFLTGLAIGGCQGVSPSQSMPPGSTYLLHLPGVSGDTVFDRGWMNALRQGGAADRVELFDWTCHDPGLGALQAYARNRHEAVRIAQLISARAAANPTGRIILTAESGGAALAVWALERLPRDLHVDQVLLVQPALSPGYDLSLALKHVREKMYYTSSPGDWLVLGLGTRLFGTSDGRKIDAAGFVGFRSPPGPYQKLVEVRYEPEWMRWGDFGFHTGGMSTAFAFHVLAPLLVKDGRVGLGIDAEGSLSQARHFLPAARWVRKNSRSSSAHCSASTPA